jgi:hypothetical protein
MKRTTLFLTVLLAGHQLACSDPIQEAAPRIRAMYAAGLIQPGPGGPPRAPEDKLAPTKRRFHVADGYAEKDVMMLDPVFTPDAVGVRAKFCVNPGAGMDFMTPDPRYDGDLERQLRAIFERWMKEGKIPSDRYYFGGSLAVAGGRDVIFSVPMQERDEVRRNFDEHLFCGWFDGNYQEFPKRGAQFRTFHLPLARWDGPLRQVQDPAPTPPRSPLAVPPAPATP